MSERGSFVTSYIYCAACLAAAKEVLARNSKGLCGQQVESWEGQGKYLPIIAGKVGGSYQGEEIHTFESELIPQLETLICHELRIAVLADSGEDQIFALQPIKWRLTQS